MDTAHNNIKQKVGNYMLTGLVCLLFLSAIFEGIPPVFDSPRTSMILTAAYLIVLLCIVVSLFPIIKIKKIYPLDLLIILWFCALVISPTQNQLILWNQLSLISLYLILRITSLKMNFHVVYHALLFITVGLCLISYAQYFNIAESNNPYFKITGPYHNPAVLAMQLGLHLSVIIAVLFQTSNKYYQLSSILVILLVVPIVYFSNSRTTVIALSAVIVFLIMKKYQQYMRKVWVCCIVGILLLLLSIGLYLLKKDSANGRVLIWKVSVNMIKDKLLCGFGTDGFTASYMHYQAKYLNEKASDYERSLASNNQLAYNFPLLLLVKYGVGAGLIYLALLLVALFCPSKNKYSLIYRALFLTFLLMSFFSYPEKLHNYMLISIIIAVSLCCHEEEHNQISVKNSIPIKIFLLFIGGSIMCNIFFLHQSYHKLNQSISNHNTSAIQKNSELLPLAYNLKGNPMYLALLAKLQYESKEYWQAISTLKQWEKLYPINDLYILKGDCYKMLNQNDSAFIYYQYAHKMLPNRQKARYKQALLYFELGLIEEARKLALEILTEKVKHYGFETYKMHQNLNKLLENYNF